MTILNPLLKNELEYRLAKWATWELKNMVQALSSGVSQFLNDDEDWERLEAGRKILRLRKDRAL